MVKVYNIFFSISTFITINAKWIQSSASVCCTCCCCHCFPAWRYTWFVLLFTKVTRVPCLTTLPEYGMVLVIFYINLRNAVSLQDFRSIFIIPSNAFLFIMLFLSRKNYEYVGKVCLALQQSTLRKIKLLCDSVLSGIASSAQVGHFNDVFNVMSFTLGFISIMILFFLFLVIVH